MEGVRRCPAGGSRQPWLTYASRGPRPVRRQGIRAKDDVVPPKIRDLVGELERAGFVDRSGKGSHRNFVHQNVAKPITLSGGLSDDAKHYQVRAVKRVVEESRS